MQAVTIVAEMADGSCIEETVPASDFGTFAGMVLAFRADPECTGLAWRVWRPEPEPPARLAHLADRLATDLSFVAGHVGGATLIVELGVDTLTAAKVRLCRMPRHAGDVAQIAGRFGLDAGVFAALVGVGGVR